MWYMKYLKAASTDSRVRLSMTRKVEPRLISSQKTKRVAKSPANRQPKPPVT